MDYCAFLRRRSAKTWGRSIGPALGGWRRAVTGGQAEAFTFIELIIVVAIIGLLAGIAAPIYADLRYKTQVETSKAIIREIEAGVNIYKYRYGTYPLALSDAMIAVPLDPWHNPYQYVSSTDPNWSSKFRYDRHLMPLNSDFDLYSTGADGQTARGLSSSKSADDVVRAGNGGFVDLGALY